MTRKQAKHELNNYGYTIDEQNKIIDTIYDEFETYLDEAMQKAKTWDAHVALQEVKDYLEGKDDTTE